MAEPASGRGRRRQKSVIIAESCPVLDAYQLLAEGCLEPGWTGVWRCTAAAGAAAAIDSRSRSGGDRAVVCLVKLRAKVGQLVISWPGENGARLTGRVRIVYINGGLGNYRPYFVCPGTRTHTEAEAGVDAGPGGAGSPIADADAKADAKADAGEDGGGTGEGNNGCGRRTVKLYFVGGQFRCRHCHGLIHASVYEPAWRRAYRKARKLRQRLGITGGGVPGKPKGMTVRDYERLLEAAQQAEALAYDAGTKHIWQLIAWIERRRKLRFTL